MAIFGIQAPAYKLSGTTYNLDYAILSPNFIQGDFIEHKSVITGDRYYILNGNYAEFSILINLYKYTSPTPKNKYIELASLYNSGLGVEFFPHRDAPSIKNSSDTVVLFQLTELTQTYLDNYLFRDTLKLTFKALKYIDITKNLL